MSRVGKKPISLPKDVSADISARNVLVKGPKGQLSLQLVDLVELKQEGNELLVVPTDLSKRARAMWGMSRTLISNLVKGVSEGFTRRLEIVGVGYRAQLSGRNLQLSLGFSHPVIYALPEGVEAQCPRPTEIILSGIDNQQLGQVAAEIRKFRPPEPYKGKGVRHAGEYIARKEGKKK